MCLFWDQEGGKACFKASKGTFNQPNEISEEFDWHRIVPKQINGARDELSQGIDKFHPPSAKRIFEKDNRAKVKREKCHLNLSTPQRSRVMPNCRESIVANGGCFGDMAIGKSCPPAAL